MMVECMLSMSPCLGDPEVPQAHDRLSSPVKRPPSRTHIKTWNLKGQSTSGEHMNEGPIVHQLLSFFLPMMLIRCPLAILRRLHFFPDQAACQHFEWESRPVKGGCHESDLEGHCISWVWELLHRCCSSRRAEGRSHLSSLLVSFLSFLYCSFYTSSLSHLWLITMASLAHLHHLYFFLASHCLQSKNPLLWTLLSLVVCACLPQLPLWQCSHT